MSGQAPARAPGVHFGLFGVPVHIDPSFFLIVGLFAAQRLTYSIGWRGAISWFVAVFVSLLVHEFGHAVAFRRFSLQPSITLYSMGGLTSAQGRLSWRRSLITSLAGPIAGLAFGGMVFVALAGGDRATNLFVAILYDDLIFVNVLWGLVNLLPLHPLDGGQSLEAILHLAKVDGAARKTSIISIVVAVGGGLYALTLNSIFLVLIAGWLAWTNWQRIQAMQAPPAGPERGPSDEA